jgi:hypothetical protein
MFRITLQVAVAVGLFTALLWAQSPAQPSVSLEEGELLLRVGILDETNGHTIKECILLLPDGRYHREYEEEQPRSFSRTPLHKSQAWEIHVFEGQLTEPELQVVRDFVNRDSFRALRKPERLKQSTQFLEGLVLRHGELPQLFLLSQAGDYKPNKDALKPLFAWFDSMRKRKHDVSKAEDDSCRIPPIMNFRAGEGARP